MTKILFPDNLHFHERGFKSLMELLKQKEYSPTFITEHNSLKALYGNYSSIKTIVLEEYDTLNKLDQSALFNKEFYGINLFNLAQAEMLSLLMSYPNWYSEPIPYDEKFIFNKAYLENKEDLLLNLSMVIFWLKFWKKTINENPGISACCLFSGSLIYTKTLSYLLQNTPVKCYVLEHFFTGNDYYFEEKYTHIANNSDIRFKNHFNKIRLEFAEKDEIEQNKDVIKAFNKLKLGKNKNVIQPDKTSEYKPFDNNNETVLIVGQVINDFSILETELKNINSLSIYKSLIEKILKETNYNIVFKAHPWEKSKVNLKRSLTKDELHSFLYSNFDKEMSSRFIIVEDVNINQLFDSSNFIVGMCSQSLIEATARGIKTHQIGDAFYGNKGFTFDHNSYIEFVDFIKENKTCGLLDLNEYSKFSEFICFTLQYHLVSVFNSGVSQLKKKLSSSSFITCLASEGDSHITPSSKLKEISSNESYDLDLPDIKNISKGKYLTRLGIFSLVVSFSSKKKAEKLKNNPEKFFMDSKGKVSEFFGSLYL